MNAPRWLAVAAVAAIASTAPRNATAQTSCRPASGPSTCVPSDNLWPSARGPFTWLGPANAAAPNTVTFGATTSWVYRPIGLTVPSADPEGTTVYPVEHAVSLHLLATLGLTSRLSFDVAAPMTLYQSGAGVGFLTGSPAALPRSASGDLRFGPTMALLHHRGLDLAARVQVVAPTGNKNAFATFGSATFAPGLSASYRNCRFRVGADVGARLRRPVEFADAVLGNQLSVGLGASYDLLPNAWLTMGVEAMGLVTLNSQYRIGPDASGNDATGGPLVPAEWLTTFSTARALDGKLRLRVGVGGGIPTGSTSAVTAPALRSVATVTFTP